MNIGFENRVVASRVTGILINKGSSSRTLREKAQAQGRLLWANAGRKVRSLVIMDSGQIYQSAIAPETLELRLIEGRKQEALQEAKDAQQD